MAFTKIFGCSEILKYAAQVVIAVIVPTPSAEITKCHVIFIVFFKFEIENTGGDGFNNFFVNI